MVRYLSYYIYIYVQCEPYITENFHHLRSIKRKEAKAVDYDCISQLLSQVQMNINFYFDLYIRIFTLLRLFYLSKLISPPTPTPQSHTPLHHHP